MTGFKLGASAQLVVMTLRIHDRDKMLSFYQNALGFALKREENELAILGNTAKNSEMIYLEESPAAVAYDVPAQKLRHMTISVPTLIELASMYQRLQTHNFESTVRFDEEQTTLMTVDPEGNQLVFQTAMVPTARTEAALLALAEEDVYLSAETTFAELALHVADVAAQTNFLTDVLGVQDAQLTYDLTVADNEAIQAKSHTALGLDFLQFTLSSADLSALVAHLRQLAQPFFVDQKETIVTIYDAIGIEWWFTLAKPTREA